MPLKNLQMGVYKHLIFNSVESGVPHRISAHSTNQDVKKVMAIVMKHTLLTSMGHREHCVSFRIWKKALLRSGMWRRQTMDQNKAKGALEVQG